MMNDDMALLREYAARRFESAFATWCRALSIS
jgi:hypothetical protein